MDGERAMEAAGDTEWLARRFETHRGHLRAVAYQMLGSLAEADDAVQETWLRLSRSDPGGVANLGGWLTTVVARVCLNMLQSRRTRREEPLDGRAPAAGQPEAPDPEQQAVIADLVGLALLVVLDRLSPPERVAFVLHDLFAVPFDEIAPIVGRTPAATRQLASRARRRIQGAAPVPDLARQRRVVSAFLAASRGGDFQALLAVLDPDVVLRADPAAVAWTAAATARGAAGAAGLPPEVRGAAGVASRFSGRAQGARMALLDGAVGAVWAQRGRTRVVFGFTIERDKIVAIDMLAEPAHVQQIDVVALED